MIGRTMKTITALNSKKDVQVVYRLVFKNTLYSLECFKEGSTNQDISNYCLVDDITDDEGEAEAFLGRMVKGKVFPVHIIEMAEDYFM